MINECFASKKVKCQASNTHLNKIKYIQILDSMRKKKRGVNVDIVPEVGNILAQGTNANVALLGATELQHVSINFTHGQMVPH